MGARRAPRPVTEGNSSVIKTVLYVPVLDNEKRPFPDETWRQLEGLLFRFGRFSWLEDVKGVWQDDGETSRDVSRQFVVSLDSWTQFPAWLELVREAKALFRQKAMYVEVAGVPEELFGNDD
jgi:hypothetical protein